MQRIFSIFWQTFGKRIVILGLMSLLSLGGIFIYTIQPSYAQIPLDSQKASETPEELTGRQKNAPLTSEEKVERAYTLREGVGIQEEKRQKAYDREAQAASNPNNPDVLYEEDLKAYKQAKPNQGVVDKAKELVKDVTGNN